MKTLTTYNFVNLTLYTAIETIVSTENLLDKGTEKYSVKLCCKDGFYNATICVDADNVWAYSANEIVFTEDEGEPVLVALTTHHADGSIDFEYSIVSEAEFAALQANAGDFNANSENPNFWFDVEDVLGGW